MKKISNPLTVIGVFCTLAEAFAGVVLIKLPAQFQNTFMWFIIVLTVMIILLFFATLNFNSKVFYAPSDFKEDSSYLKFIKFYNKVKEEVEDESDNEGGSISIKKLNRIFESSLMDVEKETKDFGKLLPHFMLQEELTSKKIAEILGKSRSRTNRIIKKYVDQPSK